MARPDEDADDPAAGPMGRLGADAVDKLLAGCQIVDRSYRYLYVNDAVVEHGRMSREALLGRTMMEVYPGIEHTEMFSVLRRCLHERTSARIENEFHFADGTTGWFELHFEPVPEGLAIFSVEVTERKRAEAALFRSMRALTTLSRCNHALVHATDEPQFVRDVCRIFVEAGGYPLAWIGFADTEDGQSIRRVAYAGMPESGAEPTAMGPAAIEGHRLPAAVAMRSGSSVVAVLADIDPEVDPVTRAAVERGSASCIALPIVDRDGAIGALTIFGAEPEAFDDAERALLEEVAMAIGYGTATLRDRQARERSRAALERAEAKTRAIYDHLPHATFVWRSDRDGFRLVDFNEAAREATGGVVATLVGRGPSTLGSVPEIEDDLRRCHETGEVVRREVWCRLAGAERSRRVVVTYGAIPPDMVLLHSEDVTEQRRTQEQLLAAQRLDAIGRLAGGVAHDFNNLLSVILSYADLALEDLEPGAPVRTAIAEIRGAGERAAALTRQLLAFSRRQRLEPQVSSLNDVVRGMERILRRAAGVDVEFEVDLDETLGCVLADRGQLEQVIMNLVVNARDAMPRGGRLTIATENVELESGMESTEDTGSGPHVVLSVRDTGIGMDADTRQRAFEPFFTTKPQGKGTGLGLSTVYGIVKQSGGGIRVHSRVGNGTTFEILLPRVDGPPIQQPVRPDEPGMDRGGARILLVEDEAVVRRVAERILAKAGHRVLVAANGEEALAVAENPETRIDLLLTDVMMPGMSGPALAEAIVRMRPAIKVLFTSGYSEHVVARGGSDSARFLAKPFSSADLLRATRETLDADGD